MRAAWSGDPGSVAPDRSGVRSSVLLHSGPCGSKLEPGPFRRGPLRNVARRGFPARPVRGNPGGRIRRRGETQDPHGDVCPQLRVLRRLLSCRPEGPAAHHDGVRKGVRGAGRDSAAHRADSGLQEGRVLRRPDPDVHGRYLHVACQPCGAPGTVPQRGVFAGRPADRHAVHRSQMGRRDAAAPGVDPGTDVRPVSLRAG